ncbi:ABC transporter ATP-binding protein [Ruminococcus callidus]|jgi:ATP-binding cassette subfamily B multidrug efflux pump|uniref:ABC transporter ATP-binding protein n=1 Tax=Ruminococcus callidus TaxID=40519 RepID=UPI0023F88AD1|nr:ABC transporter ATP-binding protein [Ruminococcus callidus]
MKPKKAGSVRRLLPYMKGYWKECILGPIFKLLEAIFELIVPLVTAKMIDVGIANRDTGYIWKMGGAMFLLAACGLAFALICQYYASKCAYGFGTALRRALYRHVNTLSHSAVDRIGTASLITRITSDSNTVQSGLNMMIRLATRCPFLIIGAAIMAMRIDLKLSIIFLIAIPIIGVLLYSVTCWTIPRYGENQGKLDNIARHTRENLDGVRVIRAFSRQDEEIESYRNDCDVFAKRSIAVGRVGAILNPASFFIMNMGIVAVLWFGGIRVDTGHLTQGELTAFVNYMTQIALSMVRMAELLISFNKAAASAKRISDVLAEEPEITDGEKPLTVQEQAPVLAFDHVTFAYPDGGEAAIHDISFSLRAGETLGIIGGTGSGKSTIANLIPRFYDTTEGTVRIYGEDVRSYTLDSLRQVIGVVPQKASLVSGTIAENLRWGDAAADDAELEHACKIAQAWEFVSQTSRGLETKVTQGGRSLSGGQKQRLTIARALVGHPKLLILDDSMSALDYATDLELRRQLAAEMGDVTKIMISQRATSIQHADHILVMDDGKCVGYGTHDELLVQCPVYADIYHTQMQ